MNAQGIEILECLEAVTSERTRRSGDSALEEAVRAVKIYQHDRFTRTYADLLRQPRYANAARFFLDELYGPKDFGQRDSQFARIVPGLVRLFPRELVETVRSLARLHSLSEKLDTAMGEALKDRGPIRLDAYGEAWRTVGTPQQREQQIALMLDVGSALDRYTRNPLLRHSLRMMRGPAQMAGVGVLQAFLERGFDTFRELRGAAEFLSTIASRERSLAARLFAGEACSGELDGTLASSASTGTGAGVGAGAGAGAGMIGRSGLEMKAGVTPAASVTATEAVASEAAISASGSNPRVARTDPLSGAGGKRPPLPPI